MPCTYILYSQSSTKFYVGSSRNESAVIRLKSHNAGKTKSTKSGRPWVVAHEEEFATYKEARQRENFLKMGQGRKWIREQFGAMAERLNAAVSKTVSPVTGTEVRILVAPYQAIMKRIRREASSTRHLGASAYEAGWPTGAPTRLRVRQSREGRRRRILVAPDSNDHEKGSNRY